MDLPRLLPALTLLACAAALCIVGLEPAHADTVPDVTGLERDEAERLLRGAGFAPRVVWRPDEPPGLVHSQEPPGWASRPRGAPVEIRVGGANPATPSTQAPPVTTPDLPASGEPGPSAPAPASGGVPMPAPGDGSEPDSYPGATAPLPPPRRAPALIPSFLGQPLEVAKRRARGRFPLRLEQTLAQPSVANHVLHQWPSSGTPLVAGRKITLVVGVAQPPSKDHVLVPDVHGPGPPLRERRLG